MPDKLDRKYIKVKNNTTIYWETVTGNVIQAIGMVEFEDDLWILSEVAKGLKLPAEGHIIVEVLLGTA